MASRQSKDVETAAVTLGCVYILAILVVWAAIIAVAVHFVVKFW